MCYWGLNCCGPPPHATIKAYNNTSPWALDWHDLKSSREVCVDIFPSATPPQAVAALGLFSTGSSVDALLMRDATDGSRHEESTLDDNAVQPATAGGSTMLTDTSTFIWWVQLRNGFSGEEIHAWAFAVDSSLAETGRLNINLATGSSPLSCGRSGGNLLLGHSASPPPGLSTVFVYYDNTGTLLSSALRGSLSVTGSREVKRAVGFVSRAGSMVVAGIESDGNNFWRRYWTFTITMPDTLTEASAASNVTTVATSTVSPPTDVGRGARVTSSHFLMRWPEEWVCVDTSSLTEQWTAAASLHFVAVDGTRAYFINTSTHVLTAYTLTSGAVAWTLDLSATITSSSATWGKILSGGYLAVMTPTSPVALVNVSTGALVTSIDVGAYDVVEYASRYIVVGPKRTTAS